MMDTKSKRHELYLRARDTMGAESAATLLEFLPKTADVATRQDLDRLRELAAAKPRTSLFDDDYPFYAFLLLNYVLYLLLIVAISRLPHT